MKTLARYSLECCVLRSSSWAKEDPRAALRKQGHSSHWMTGALAMWRAAADRTCKLLNSSGESPTGMANAECAVA
eukprot:7118347-Pyramimonas_sp.AAC.1